MQKILNLLKPKAISITEQQWEFISEDMAQLGIHNFSEYIRILIEARRGEVPPPKITKKVSGK
jgi:hypothetical protein